MFGSESKPFALNFRSILEQQDKHDSNMSVSKLGRNKNDCTQFKWNFNPVDRDHTPKMEFLTSLNDLKESSIQVCVWENKQDLTALLEPLSGKYKGEAVSPSKKHIGHYEESSSEDENIENETKMNLERKGSDFEAEGQINKQAKELYNST